MDYPLVSILIPAHNHAQFVEQSLNSALVDPYPNKELVIIDDGSADGTDEKIAGWVAKHAGSIAIEYHRRGNRGVSATLNELAARAKGEFLRFNASDDYILPGGVHAQVEYLQNHPGKLVVIGDSLVINENGDVLFKSGMVDLYGVNKANYCSDDGIRRQIISKWAGGPGPMLRKRAFESLGGWNEDLRIEDWDFFLRLVAIDALGFVDMNICTYRLHSNNTSRTDVVTRRISNLNDLAASAHRNIANFEGPYRVWLKAQCQLIAAKIAFLKRQPFAVAVNMFGFISLKVLARFKMICFTRERPTHVAGIGPL